MPPIIFSLTYDVVQSGLLLAFCGYSSRPTACPLSAVKRTFLAPGQMSAFGGKADIPDALSDARF